MWLIFDVIRKPTDTSDVQTKNIYADMMRIIIIILIEIAFVIEAFTANYLERKRAYFLMLVGQRYSPVFEQLSDGIDVDEKVGQT